MKGTTIRCESHSTIVLLFCKDHRKKDFCISFDHRCFYNFWEILEGKIIGRKIEYTGNRIRLLDTKKKERLAI